MNYSKSCIKLKQSDAAIHSKPMSSTRFHKINESVAMVERNENISARTFLHLENRASLNLKKSQAAVNLISSFPCLERTFDGQGQKFSSTTIVNGSTSSHRQVHRRCADERVVVLPVETIVPDDANADDDILMDPSVLKVEDTFSSEADLPENCYFTVQRECVLEQNPRPTKVTKVSGQRILPPPVGNGKRGLIRYGRSRMIADTHTSIPVAEFKAQLKDTMDITGKMELAPPTKRMMYLLNTKGVNKLFAIPGRKMGSKTSNLFVRHLTLKQTPADTIYDDMPLLPVGFKPEIDKSKIKRITRKRRYPEAEEYQRNLYKLQLENFHSMQADADDPDQCKISIFMDQNGILSDGKNGSVILTPLQAIQVAIQEEEVLGDFLYQEDLKGDPDVTSEVQEMCFKKFGDAKHPVIVVNDGKGSEEKIEGVLVEAEKVGICREEIEKVIIFQQDLDDDINTSFYSKNGNFIIMSCDPNEPEIVVS